MSRYLYFILLSLFPWMLSAQVLSEENLRKVLQQLESEGRISVNNAEISLNDSTLAMNVVRQPQGFVDVNSPWLHVSVPFYDENDINSVKKAKRARLIFKRRFYFELSQDKSFQRDVYRSGPKRWSFYNPYEYLEKGTWYWRYGVADPDTPDKPVWNDEVYQFIITGNEHKIPIPPKPEVFLNQILSRPSPTYMLLNEEFEKLLPDKEWPEMANWARRMYSRYLENDLPMNFTVSDQDAIDAGYKDENGKANAELLFYRKRMNTLLSQCTRYISNLIGGYVLLGDVRYRDMAIQKATDIIKFYETASFYIESLNKTLVLKEEVWTDPYMLKELIDIAPDAMTEVEREKVINEQYPADWSAPIDFESAEHTVYDQHLWQEIANKFKIPMTYARYREEAREEMKWVYELWCFRVPNLGRNDGGSLEGDGYLGVHDTYLGALPWLIYKLTGFNYMLSRRWFENLGKYLQYDNPFGTNISGFCDGDGTATTLPYSMESFARMNPTNYWNLWRFKNTPRTDYKSFTADLGKNNKALSMLSLMTQFPVPDTTGLEPPKVLAAIFRDVGEVDMHTDFLNKEKDFQVMMHSSPYGSLMHTHPCQNAFNLAYGGQDIFWKAGFYNGGSLHNLLSYKCSRAHNTIIADGMVQGFNRSAYGYMPRFATGDKISYAIGDASNAYNGENRYNDGKSSNPKLWQPLYGFGKPGVKRFRRHLAMLRPNYVLIYDELEADKPITWQFRIHSRRNMKLLEDGRLMSRNDFASASVKMYCLEPFETSLVDKDLPFIRDENEALETYGADVWKMSPVDDENKLPKPIPSHYHGMFTTDKFQKMRFFTLIKIHPDETDENYVPEAAPEAVIVDGMATLHLEGYTVKVQLDGNKPSYIEVHDTEGIAALVSGSAAETLQLGNVEKKAKVKGSTLLLENQTHRGDIFVETSDSIPDMLIYGNKY